MSSKATKLAIALMAVSLLLIPAAVVSAQEGQPGSAGGTACVPDGTWTQINRGKSHWYSFTYDGAGGQVTATLSAEPSGGAQFRVLTYQQLAQVRTRDDMGMAYWVPTTDELWAGTFTSPGTYFVQVKFVGSRNTPTYYALTVSGPGVSMPPGQGNQATQPCGQTNQVQQGNQGSQSSQPSSQSKQADQGNQPSQLSNQSKQAGQQSSQAYQGQKTVRYGLDAATACAPNGTWTQISQGQSHWYAFNYPGATRQVIARLQAEPDGGAQFRVLTAQQLANVQTQNAADTAFWVPTTDELWAGTFPAPGTYYVQVRLVGRRSAPTYYALTVSGPGVSMLPGQGNQATQPCGT